MLGTPLHLLQSGHTFEVEDVRICPIQAGRLEGSVEVQQEMILGGCPGHSLVEFHHDLVVPVHEVHLEAFDAHLGEVLADTVDILVHGLVSCPEDQTHVPFGGIGY